MLAWFIHPARLSLVGAFAVVILTSCARPAATVPTSPLPTATAGATAAAPTPVPPTATAGAPAAPKTAADTPTAVPAGPSSADVDVALKGKATVSAGQDSAANAIDGDPGKAWNSGQYPVQWYLITLDKFYAVDRLDLLVTMAPAGKTSQEIWLGDTSGAMTLYKQLNNVDTKDGQTLTVDVNPPKVVDRVLVRTVAGPSFVAWREIRVWGQPPGSAVNPVTTGNETFIDWPTMAVSGGYDLPVEVTNAGDGSNRLFVVEQHGTILVSHNGQPSTTPFLSIESEVKCCEEQGLLSIVFPPGYPQKHYFYVSYTDQSNALVISRFQVTSNPDVADPASEQTILKIPEPTTVHHGGHLAFGPKDGYLYVGSGDGGVPADQDRSAQDPSNLRGKLLRLDTESGASPYAIPPTNPFVGKDGYRPEIWSMGFRNPWGFGFDPQSGDLYIANVGENTYESLDYQPAASKGGENYGWPILEGVHCFATTSCDQRGLTLPVLEYTHDIGCAIVGGTVYRGTTFPRMQGVYFYADLCSGRIWGLRHDGGAWENTQLLQLPFQVSSIGTDEAGNIYVTNYNQGAVMQLYDVPPSTPTPYHS
jgi:glucose/arabinose dehydrogenase